MAENENKIPEIAEERHDLKILQSLRKIIHSVDIHSRKLKMQYDITAPQLIVLLAVTERGALTIAAMSKEVHLSSSTLVGIVDRLEVKGYIVRERNARDRRQVLVRVTDEGRDFVKRAPSPLQETLAKALSELTSLEQATISLSLERVVEMMKAREIQAEPILQTGSIDDKNH